MRVNDQPDADVSSPFRHFSSSCIVERNPARRVNGKESRRLFTIRHRSVDCTATRPPQRHNATRLAASVSGLRASRCRINKTTMRHAAVAINKQTRRIEGRSLYYTFSVQLNPGDETISALQQPPYHTAQERITIDIIGMLVVRPSTPSPVDV